MKVPDTGSHLAVTIDKSTRYRATAGRTGRWASKLCRASFFSRRPISYHPHIPFPLWHTPQAPPLSQFDSSHLEPSVNSSDVGSSASLPSLSSPVSRIKGYHRRLFVGQVFLSRSGLLDLELLGRPYPGLISTTDHDLEIAQTIPSLTFSSRPSRSHASCPCMIQRIYCAATRRSVRCMLMQRDRHIANAPGPHE